VQGVILAIGNRGADEAYVPVRTRKLDSVKRWGEDDKVKYLLTDLPHTTKHIVVVGAGNSAIESVDLQRSGRGRVAK
jgi:hypothetical protein